MRKNQNQNRKSEALNQALDALIEETGHSPEAILGNGGVLAQMTKALIERVLGAELTHHLKTGRGPAAGLAQEADGAAATTNCRNGYSPKTVIGDSGAMQVDVPRDRAGSFEPLLVPRWQKKLPGFEEKIIALSEAGAPISPTVHAVFASFRKPVRADTVWHCQTARHMDVCGNYLRNIADIIQRAGFTPSVRGEGTARFVYAEHTDRAVEVYWDGEGFTVEHFEQPSEVSVRDCQQDTPAIAAEQAVEWLSRHDNAV